MHPTSQPDLDRAVEAVGNEKERWARLPIGERITLARECVRGTFGASEAIASAGCEAKGLDPRSALSAEEWMAGPVAILRNIRLLVEALSDIQRAGTPRLPPSAVCRLANGQIAARVFPRDMYDRLMFPSTRIDVWMQPGVDEKGLPATMAIPYHRRDPGRLALVLGAGNVASIGPMDVLYKLFVENQVVILKMHPVNDYLGPLIERAFRPLVAADYLRIVYGDVSEGQYLVHHAGVEEIHMTGSAAVHDRIVWGDTADEQARRRARHDPKVTKRITSELGCVTPVIVVPGRWTSGELDFQAENVATMVANNASCNCNAAKLLVTWRGWRQRQAFLDRIAAVLGTLPARKAYYPGSVRRYAAFTAHPKAHARVTAGEVLPYLTIYDVDPSATTDVVFTQEAWCPIIAETALDADDEGAFLDAAVNFCNERVAGTLSIDLLVDPRSRARVSEQIDRALADLRYGTIAVNHWAAASYALAVAPWGAYPGHTLEDVGSGIGFVHNTMMFGRPQKTVLSGPFTTRPKPAWFSTHPRGHIVARRMTAFEAAPSAWRFAALAAAAMRP